MHSNKAIIVRFWGTRGSIPTPGPGTVIFGGNTVCIEVDCSDDSLIILDSGTGIRLLGYDIMRRQVRKIKLFITHTHWDHIQGLPYFAPFYHPDCEIDVYGPLYYGKTFEDVLSVQMDHFFFPVQQKELRAAIRYHDLKEGDCIQFPGLSIQTKFMNHPVITLGYKLIFDQGTVTFTGDHEPYSLFQHHDNTSIKELKQQMEDNIIDFIRDTDYLVMEAQYSAHEYETRQGWGHSSFISTLQTAHAAKVKHLYIIHHDPDHSDAFLKDTELRLKQHVHDKLDNAFKVQIAREGSSFVV